jgi:primosomal protein N' (replication factor Y)
MEIKFAKIVFNLPLEESYIYSVPIELKHDIKVGQRVLVNFGKRNITGVVMKLSDTTAFNSLKPILKILDTNPVINDEMIQFCKWVSEYYFCPIGEVIFSAIPKSVLIESKIMYSLNIEYKKNESVNATQEKIIKALKDKSLTLKQIEKRLKTGNLRDNIQKLQSRNVLIAEHIISKEKVKPKKEKYITFDLKDDFGGYTKSMMENFAKETGIRSQKQINVLNYFIKQNISIIGYNYLIKQEFVG